MCLTVHPMIVEGAKTTSGGELSSEDRIVQFEAASPCCGRLHALPRLWELLPHSRCNTWRQKNLIVDGKQTALQYVMDTEERSGRDRDNLVHLEDPDRELGGADRRTKS